MTAIDGGCHCGNIRWRFTPAQPLSELPARRCACTFCTKHGAVYTSDPDGQLSVEIEEADEVSVYRFGTCTTEPQICRRCGVMPLILVRIEGQVYGVVNLATAESPVVSPERIENVNFEHQTPEERSARRARTWIGDVSVHAS